MITLMDRFWAKVRKTDSCWIWTAGKSNGYGYIGINRKVTTAHALSYRVHKGKIRKGLQIDHLCRNRSCVNPEHLEAVTPKENNARSHSPSAKNKTKLFCKRGHKFTEKNIYRFRGNRYCRTCKPMQDAKTRLKRRIERIGGYIPDMGEAVSWESRPHYGGKPFIAQGTVVGFKETMLGDGIKETKVKVETSPAYQQKHPKHKYIYIGTYRLLQTTP